MKRLKQTILLAALAALSMAASASAQENKTAVAPDAEKNKYQNVEVVPFTAQEEVNLTADELKVITETVVKELRDIKKFKQVLREGETATEAGAPTLKVTGTVVKFKKGSRAKRYFVGFGAGKTKMIANVKFIDGESGQVLYEYVADGDVHMGIFGGDSGGAKSEMAEQVAKYAKKKFF
ncbi:MAG TPA: DUF4410 domain-containing protein [Pyrinomonadaceae bacterium]|nr:DUF4410 domain-containing protein [Pyrinomonadaceae bacterium]